MRLVTYPAQGLVLFSTPKVCVYTSCRNHTGSDKISKTFSRILLPFCLITLPKDKLDFMPQSATMCMANLKHIPHSIEVEWLHSSMAAIGVTIIIKSAQSDTGLTQAICKVSLAILDFLTALYYPAEWLSQSSLYWVYCWLWSWAFRVWFATRKWWEPRVLRPAQWTIYCWEHWQQLVRLSWVDDGAFWLLCSNHLGLYTACITGLTCNLMSNWVRLFVIVMHSADDFTQLI